jgi:hypothetical protein
MDGKDESRAPQRTIDAAAKATFLAALRAGTRREVAADEAGFSLTGFYGARRRDPVFAADWAAALAGAPAAERRTRAYAERDEAAACPERSRRARGEGEVRHSPANRRLWQRRRRTHVRFTLERQELFLEHFAATGDTKASAQAAGVSESTVHLHRRMHPEFAELYREALAIAYPRLEEEAVRLRLANQARLRAAVERGACREPGRNGTRCPTCGHDPDDDAQFDRTLALLARWDRKQRRVESPLDGGRRHRATFQEFLAAADKKLRALGLRSEWPPKGKGAS